MSATANQANFVRAQVLFANLWSEGATRRVDYLDPPPVCLINTRSPV